MAIDKLEFNKCMQIFFVYFGSDCMTKDKVRLYYEFLKNYSYEELKKAFMRILSERVYKNVPQIAEILQYLKGTTEKDLEINITLAKETLKRAISKYGSYSSIQFEDKGIHAVIDSVGGWTYLCAMDIKDFEKFMTFEFSKIYKTYKQLPYKVSEYFLGHMENGGIKNIGYDGILETKELKKIVGNGYTKKIGELPNKYVEVVNG